MIGGPVMRSFQWSRNKDSDNEPGRKGGDPREITWKKKLGRLDVAENLIAFIHLLQSEMVILFPGISE